MLRDESHAERWRQIHPTPLEYRPLHLARVPTGHLLNLFADVVKQYDEGSFSAEFVNGLHDEIRTELESRAAHELIRATPPSNTLEGAESLAEFRVPSQGGEVELAKPFNLDDYRLVISKMTLNDSGIEYLWLVPAHRVQLSASDADFTNTDARKAFHFRAFPTGFHRSGLGLRS